MVFVSFLAQFAIVTTMVLLWARWSQLDLGFSAPEFRKSEPWVLLFILGSAAQWAIAILPIDTGPLGPVDVDPRWLARMEQLSLSQDLVVSVLLAPLSEELLFRGAMFAALLRRWGIGAAVIAPSLLWGLLHVQYEWWVVAYIVGLGVLLAMIRWKSGSLYLPIALHAAGNLLVTLSDHGLLSPVA